MKSKILQFLAAIAAALSVIGILDLSGFIAILPKEWAVWVAGLPAVAATIYHIIMTFCDQFDDGEINGSFKLSKKSGKSDGSHLPSWALWFALGLMTFGLSACNLTIRPDGSKEASVDRKSLHTILEIIAEK